MSKKDRPTRLLLVEDHPDTVDFLERRLVEEGFEVVTACSGELAMMALRQRRCVDVVVMDIHLPMITGDDIVTWMRGEPRLKKIPVVFVTADSPRRVARLLDSKTTRCLEKPLSTDKLLATIHELLGPSM